MDMLIIDELSIIGVFDRGIANKERIVLRPTIISNNESNLYCQLNLS